MDLPVQQANQFLNLNHVQGSAVANRSFALIDSTGVTRAVLAVQAPRSNKRTNNKPGHWTIVRYATHGTVLGGFTKLLRFAEHQLPEITRWVTYADLAISYGHLYVATGFSVDRLVPPDYKYTGAVTRWQRRSKESFQRKRFRNDPDLLWDETWTEAEAAQHNNVFRVWDCGKLRFIRDVVR
ncbi:MAG TPA: hypothetical protein VFU07_05350 [Candidatus Lumbricidophila sp.]|nr:hypothetical protein [Candidatus Lumbricidophila sp.]